MRTLAIGDVHGCLSALDALLSALALQSHDTLIFLGDYIDRGPNSATVLNRLLLLRTQCQVITLMGNHEQMLLGSRTNPLLHREWVANGGDMTLQSYGSRLATLRDIPPDHWAFLAALPLYHQTATHIFVHAGVQPHLPLDKQPEYSLLWERFNEPSPHVSGKTVVCGHTPARSVRTYGHSICIDTAAFKHDGFLTCLDVTTGRLTHANQKGQIRTTQLTERRTP